MRHVAVALSLSCMAVCGTAHAEGPRDMLLGAAYGSPNKTAALARIGQALASAEAVVKRNPGDMEARLQRGIAISYRGKLTRSRSDVLAARRDFEAVAAAQPKNPEAQMALAGWHLGSVIELGSLVARTALGARTAAGEAALGRAVALGGTRPAILALASLHQIQIDSGNVAAALKLADAAQRASAENAMDRVMQKQATTLAAALRKGNGKAAAATAERLMPFGRLEK